MTNKQIKQIIIDSCVKAREMGRVINHNFGHEYSPACCALTAVELVNFGASKMNAGDTAREYFDWECSQRWAFIHGFDFCKGGVFAKPSLESETFPAIFKMGKEVAAEIKPDLD